MDDVTEGFISVNGGNVWYRITGNGRGTPLLLLHGGPGGKSSDRDPLRSLGQERPIIQYDQLGCGNSGHPRNTELWTVERYVEELEQVRKALELEEVHILGHSWGTMLLAAFLSKQPKGVKSVIFSGPALQARRWERDQRNHLKKMPLELQAAIEKNELQKTTDSPEYQAAMYGFYHRHLCRLDPWPPEVSEELENMNQQIYNFMWGASEFTVTGTLQDYDAAEWLRELKMPALFTCGRYDEATPEATAYYASLVRDSQFHVFENSSHMPSVEEPEAYTKKIQKFLNYEKT